MNLLCVCTTTASIFLGGISQFICNHVQINWDIPPRKIEAVVVHTHTHTHRVAKRQNVMTLMLNTKKPFNIAIQALSLCYLSSNGF